MAASINFNPLFTVLVLYHILSLKNTSLTFLEPIAFSYLFPLWAQYELSSIKAFNTDTPPTVPNS